MNNQFFDSRGVPVEALRGLLDLFKSEDKEHFEHVGSLPDIVCATQLAWYKKGIPLPGFLEQSERMRNAVMPFLEQLGFIDEIVTAKQQHDWAIVLGGKKKAIRKRYAQLRKEWATGIRFPQLVMCGSDRPNDEVVSDFDNEELPFLEDALRQSAFQTPIPADETDLMEAIYELSRSSFGWNKNVIPLFKKTSVKDRQANTRDTLTDWGTFPTGKILLVSSQPFVSYQAIIARKCLPSNCEIEAIGAAASATLPISVYFDNLAKILFELTD